MHSRLLINCYVHLSRCAYVPTPCTTVTIYLILFCMSVPSHLPTAQKSLYVMFVFSRLPIAQWAYWRVITHCHLVMKQPIGYLKSVCTSRYETTAFSINEYKLVFFLAMTLKNPLLPWCVFIIHSYAILDLYEVFSMLYILLYLFAFAFPFFMISMNTRLVVTTPFQNYTFKHKPKENLYLKSSLCRISSRLRSCYQIWLIFS